MTDRTNLIDGCAVEVRANAGRFPFDRSLGNRHLREGRGRPGVRKRKKDNAGSIPLPAPDVPPFFQVKALTP